MRLYLDTEFNGHGGELLSLALVGDDGSHWSGIAPYAGMDLHPWVAENVVPKLHMDDCMQYATMDYFRKDLRAYLEQRSGATIYADWPDDFAHLMRLMSGPSYDESFMVGCTMHLITTPPGQPIPAIPHNALSDAIALMEWHRESGSKNEAR